MRFLRKNNWQLDIVLHSMKIAKWYFQYFFWRGVPLKALHIFFFFFFFFFFLIFFFFFFLTDYLSLEMEFWNMLRENFESVHLKVLLKNINAYLWCQWTEILRYIPENRSTARYIMRKVAVSHARNPFKKPDSSKWLCMGD